MPSWFWGVAVGLLTGVISGCGIGGGSLLILYLTLIGGIDHYTAGGINLLYFLCCAPTALIGHIRRKRIEWPLMRWCTLAGAVTSVAAAYAASLLDVSWLRRGFGVLLLFIGVRELFCRSK